MGAQAGGGPFAAGTPGSLGLGKGRLEAGLLGKFTASCPSPFSPACPAPRRRGPGIGDGTRRRGCRGSWVGGRRRAGEALALRWHLPLEARPRLWSPSDLFSLNPSPLSHPLHLPGFSGMRRSPDVSPRRLSDISPQLRQLKYLVVDEAIKEDLKWSRSVEDLTGGPAGLTSIEERILRITGYYGYQPWAASYKSKTPRFVCPVPLPWRGPLSLGNTRSHASSRPSASLPADIDPALQLSERGPEMERSRTFGISDSFLYLLSSLHTPLSLSLCYGVVTVRRDWKQCTLR